MNSNCLAAAYKATLHGIVPATVVVVLNSEGGFAL